LLYVKRLRIFLDRPRLWRVTAALSALLLCGALAALGQGSVDVIAKHPVGRSASWEPWCAAGQPRVDRVRLAFCARVEGIVVSSSRGPGRTEAHVAIVGGFHLTIVKLPDLARVPGIGNRVVAIGPLFRSRDGQREVQAFKLEKP
jgi:hypothetical protein